MEREALKLALEALETCYEDEWHSEDDFGLAQTYDENKVAQAITAIKEALAQPAQEENAITNYAHLLMVKCFNEEYDEHLEKNMTGYVSKKMLGAARLPDTPSARAYLDKVLDDDDTQVYAADTTIVQTLLPKLYSIIDRLLDGQDKALVIEARRVLPKAYKNSFEKGKNNG